MSHAPSRILQLNAFTWLSALRSRTGRKLTLASIPDAEWKAVRERGFDAVWLMGVWKRSPKALQGALQSPGLKLEYDRVIPGWIPDDVAGSAYAIADYAVDPYLGLPKELAALRLRLNRHGLKLLVDFVPNHTACDHRWTLKSFDRFVRPTPSARRAHPERFYKPFGGVYLAHGRDPHFAPWNDTAQINAFSPDARAAMRRALASIARVADGVRCDMAMLVLNDVFKKTWGDCVSAPPAAEFWDDVLAPVKKEHPDFFAMAEVYWGMGPRLLELGFDAVYDKALYDRFVEGSADAIRHYLHDSQENQSRQVRFVENHDEARMVTKFGRPRALAAQAATLTLPGIRLVHQDQASGFLQHVPVQLRRFTPGPEDTVVFRATGRLLNFLKHPAFQGGRWHLIDPHPAWPGSTAHRNVLAWVWTRGADFALTAVNYGPETAAARLRLPIAAAGTGAKRLRDWTDDAVYEREGSELGGEGLYVELQPWKYHLLAPDPAVRKLGGRVN